MPPRGETTSRPAIEFEHYQDSELLGIELTNDAFVALDKIENRPAAFCDPASGFEKSFGYFDNSQSNTMALLRKVGSAAQEHPECMCSLTGAVFTKLTLLSPRLVENWLR